MVHHGTGRAEERIRRAQPESDLVISTYGLACRDIEDLSGPLEQHHPDEAQNIKNPVTAGTRSATLRRSSSALTGTPVENRLSEPGRSCPS